ncbi:helix-turn-helix domain-containing protein [Burkholderia glumae]|uniref:helix-turn-helix domain-containing protein n=1 Tax=Burkholderia glumae TaxID=337 RepID=UPI0009B7DB81|nr:helix-turn-helix transcriptional regulator [Burkholderia glumae]MCM2493063.1 helix-turn-helix domain-containing protein [Burkholderia glumae]
MEAQQLVSLLRERGLSQKEIAKRSGLSQGAISHIETGRRKNVMASTLRQLESLAAETGERSGSVSQ